MGNFSNLDSDIIERTLSLIDQYYERVDEYPFKEQYNYTLLLNCLLGLIVMPKERVLKFIPNFRLTREGLNQIGLAESQIDHKILDLRSLIVSLRNSIAHFDINVISENNSGLIDWIEFRDSQNNENIVARFKASEILGFLKFYSISLIENLKKYKYEDVN